MTDRPLPDLDRAHLPSILWLVDVAVVLGLPSERAARDALTEYGIPFCRVGRRTYVLAESLLDYLKTQEVVPPSREEIKKRVDQTIRQIAPTGVQRRRGRKPPRIERE